MLHGHLLVLGHEAADDDCGDGAACQGVVGVDDGALLGIPTRCCSAIETWPEHPQENSSNLEMEDWCHSGHTLTGFFSHCADDQELFFIPDMSNSQS